MGIVKKFDAHGNVAGFWDEEGSKWVPEPLLARTEPEAQTEPTGTDREKLTKEELKAILDQREVDYDSGANKAELVALVEESDEEFEE